jgi:hypothetical protein
MIWINIESRGTTPQNGKSYINHDEISVVQQVATYLLEARPLAKIAVHTFTRVEWTN